MENYTQEQYEAAKNANIANFLQSRSYELVRNGNGFHGKMHDSLVIRENGAWYWNSKNLHGYSPIELFKQILIYDYGETEKTAYIHAIQQLSEFQGVFSSPENATKSIIKPQEKSRARPSDEPLILPQKNADNRRVYAYLSQKRGIDKYFIDGLIKWGKLYEANETHNCVFVAFDQKNRPQNAFQRGTLSDKPFKKDVENSDKTYAFTLCGNLSSNKVYVFESAIDCISHANLAKNRGEDWREVHRLSLGGVSSGSLARFCAENPQISEIVFTLDDDEAGNKASEKIAREFGEKYAVSREKPRNKDWNEDLIQEIEEKNRENAKEIAQNSENLTQTYEIGD